MTKIDTNQRQTISPVSKPAQGSGAQQPQNTNVFDQAKAGIESTVKTVGNMLNSAAQAMETILPGSTCAYSGFSGVQLEDNYVPTDSSKRRNTGEDREGNILSDAVNGIENPAQKGKALQNVSGTNVTSAGTQKAKEKAAGQNHFDNHVWNACGNNLPDSPHKINNNKKVSSNVHKKYIEEGTK